MKTFLILITLLLLPVGGLHAQVPTVSLLQLIATPEKYDGKTVRFEGVTHIEFEGDAIFLSKEHCQHRISSFALWLDLNEELKKNRKWLNGRYCILEGVFHAKDRGHMGLYMGTLSAVTMFLEREAISPDEAAALQKKAAAEIKAEAAAAASPAEQDPAAGKNKSPDKSR